MGTGRAGPGCDAGALQLAMGRTDSLAKLALAYGLHLARRRLSRPRSQIEELFETYAPDGIRALQTAERERHPHLVGCINCGLCALAAGRIGNTPLPDLATSYIRLYSRVSDASSALTGAAPVLARASV